MENNIINNRIDRLEKRMDKYEEKIEILTRLECAFDNLNSTLIDTKNQMQKFNEQIIELKEQEHLRDNKSLEKENGRQYEWIKYVITVLATLLLGYIGVKLGIK